MNILFIVPRYHTNLIPVIEILKTKNHNIKILCQYKTITENYDLVEPIVLKESVIFSKVISRFIPKRNNEYLRTKYYVANKKFLSILIKEYMPDLIILRDRNFLSLQVYQICNKLGYRNCITYNQSPLHTIKTNSLIKKIWRKFHPKVRITPVLIDNPRLLEANKKYSILPHEYYIPFTIKTNISQRSYFINKKINILVVGKFREYKNIKIVVNAIHSLDIDSKSQIKLTIVGQMETNEEKLYYKELLDIVKNKKLENIIDLYCNIAYNDMKDFYLNNDLLILPSKKELASISVLEAMSFGLAVLSTDNNGTGTYVYGNNQSGMLFVSENVNDLKDKITYLVRNKDIIMKFAQNSILKMKTEFSQNKYLELLNNVVMNEFNISL